MFLESSHISSVSAFGCLGWVLFPQKSSWPCSKWNSQGTHIITAELLHGSEGNILPFARVLFVPSNSSIVDWTPNLLLLGRTPQTVATVPNGRPFCQRHGHCTGSWSPLCKDPQNAMHAPKQDLMNLHQILAFLTRLPVASHQCCHVRPLPRRGKLTRPYTQRLVHDLMSRTCHSHCLCHAFTLLACWL